MNNMFQGKVRFLTGGKARHVMFEMRLFDSGECIRVVSATSPRACRAVLISGVGCAERVGSPHQRYSPDKEKRKIGEARGLLLLG